MPFRQVVERGFDCHDDQAPLRCLVVTAHHSLPRAEVLAVLPAEPVALADAGFDIPDEEYADIVRTVIADEIGRGEGANFVIRRDFTARVDVDPLTAVSPGSARCSSTSAARTGLSSSRRPGTSPSARAPRRT